MENNGPTQPPSGEIHFKFVGTETGTHEYTGTCLDDALDQFYAEMEPHDLKVVIEDEAKVKLVHPSASGDILVDTLEIQTPVA